MRQEGELVNQIDLKGKRAIITGGVRGIGMGIAQRFLDSGASVALWDVRTDDLQKACEALSSSGTVIGCEVDVTNPESIAAGVETVSSQLGGIDILVNNAGVAGDNATVWDTKVEEWRRVIDIDLNGVFFCCRAIAPVMIEGGWGRIVNIASIAGKEGNPLAAHYSAAKAGVIGLTKSLGKELVGTGVLCNGIAPAVIETPILEQVSQKHLDFMLSKIPMGRLGQVEEVGALVAWLSSDDCSFSTGAIYDISGGRATY